MIRKSIWGLLIFTFFAGFILVRNSSARPDPRRGANPWIEDKTVGIPHTHTPSIENMSNALSRTSLSTDGDNLENNSNNSRAIVRPDFLMLEIKRVNGR